jgi:hypothetical protein
MGEAARLRAQKAYSTDPDYLERMALAEEASEKTRSTRRETTPAATIKGLVADSE